MAKRWFGFSAPDRARKNKRLPSRLAAALFLLAAVSAWPADPGGATAGTGAAEAAEIRAFLSLPAFEVAWRGDAPQAIRVGDELLLKVVGISLPEVKSPAKELSIEPPPIVKSLIKEGFEIFPLDPQEAKDAIPENELWFVATPAKGGKITLPALALKKGDQTIGRTQPFPIEVASAIKPDDPKPDVPADVKPPVRLPFPWWILASFAVLALAVVGALIYWAIRWSRKRRLARLHPARPLEQPKSEDEIALTALDALEKQGFAKKGQFKPHYFGVSEIFKSYLGARYRFDAAESTSYEIIRHFEAAKVLSDALVDRIESLFERLDQVKFTDHVPEASDATRVLQEARQLVLETRKPAVQPAFGSPEGPRAI